MAKHVAELLTEINKKISELTDRTAQQESSAAEKQKCIDDLNDIIRSLDHIVEEIQKKD